MSTREKLLECAELLVPTLRERSESCERLRRCPDETIADYTAAGFLRVCQPKQFGGFELGWDVLCEVGQTLARGCGSQAWLATIMSDHAHILSNYPLAAQQEVWGDDPDTRICASFLPVGKAKPVAGGVTFSGRHSFASGIDHASWALCGGIIEGGEGPKGPCLFLVPLTAATIIDDWHVMGLSGTGSKSFEVKDVFVPTHRILSYKDMEDASGPGAKIHTAPVFRFPHGGLAASVFAAIATGIAEGFFAEYLRITGARRSRGAKVAEQMGTQIIAAHAGAEIEAASNLYLEPLREAMAMVTRGEPVPRHLRLRSKRNSTFAAHLARQAVERLFNAAGATAMFSDNALQHYFRDLHGAVAHTALVWDVGMSEYGRLILGADPLDH